MFPSRPYRLIVGCIVCLCLFWSTACIASKKTAAIGIWVTNSTVDYRVVQERAEMKCEHPFFRYDGKHVTLPKERPEWDEDGYVCYKAKWKGNRLFYRNKGGKLIYIASFEKGRFMLDKRFGGKWGQWDDLVFNYKKVEASSLAERTQPIVQERAPYNHRLMNKEPLKIKVYGLPVKTEFSSCEQRLQSKYGFYYKFMGCAVPFPSFYTGKRVERKLEKRNGKGWREKYEEEMQGCIN